jgi:hypothetical protein
MFVDISKRVIAEEIDVALAVALAEDIMVALAEDIMVALVEDIMVALIEDIIIHNEIYSIQNIITHQIHMYIRYMIMRIRITPTLLIIYVGYSDIHKQPIR